ncbi:class I adenylate-forming enzyme family protein [Streptomyces sp. NPDC057638]|uniref:class I adenylate-forming enzyme family protein n=1 Tax=Streptomyces sp. NPDC057638 TaxID=3346190 RepID=UPI003690D88B
MPERTPEQLLTALGAPFAAARDEDGVLRYTDGPRTLREVFETIWAHGERPFLIAEHTTYTYRSFFAAVCALARELGEEYGARPGDRVAIALRNHPEWQVAFWATQIAGLVAVPLNAWWTAAELEYALDDCAPTVLFVDDERLPRVDAWRRRNGTRTIALRGDRPRGGPAPDGVEWYEEGRPDPYGAPPPVEVRPEDDATLIYTSGTTGRPKGAVATHLAQAGAALHPRYFAALSALERGAVPGLGAAPVTLMTFPFFHVAAFTTLYAAMGAGGSLVLMRKWDAERALALIERHQVTHYSGVPTTALQLLEAARRAGSTLPSLTHLNTGGAPAPPALLTLLAERCGRRVEPRSGYGLTETSGGVLAHFGERYWNDPAGAGAPAPAVEIRVAGPHGGQLPDGEIGELWLRGQSLVRGYWRDAPATAAAFPDGWLRTGDLALMRAGRVSVVDRLRDMVVRGGENVYCAEVEAVLQDHPGVADAAVLGVAHPELGEEVAAVVRTRPGVTLTAEEVRTHVGRTLAGFKVPARVMFGEVPRNPTGKILKRELRRRLDPG